MAKVHKERRKSGAQCIEEGKGEGGFDRCPLHDASAHRTVDSGTADPGTGEEASVHEPLTVRSLLEEPLLRASEVYGDQLDRLVEWCLPLSEAIGEPGSLAGVVAVASDRELEGGGGADQVRRLAEVGLSALFVAPGADRASVAGVVPIGEASGLPLVVMPDGATYQRVSRLIGEKSLTREAHVLAYGIGVQRELADVLYRGAGLTAMARRVSRLSGRPIFVLGAQLEVLAYESLTPAAVPDPDELVRTLKEAIVAGRVDPAPEDQALASELVTLKLEHGAVSCVVAPMVLGGATYGWVAIVELDDPPRRHDVAQHLVLAQQAAMTAGSEILRLRSVEEAQERARGDFVHALLHERFASPHELGSRAAFHEFDVSAVYVVVVAAGVFDPASAEGMAQLRRAMRVSQQLDGASKGITMPTSVGDLLVVVRQVGPGRPRGRDNAKEQAAASEYARTLDAALSTGAGGKVRVAFGRTGIGQPGVMHSYREARVALEIAARVRRDGLAGYSDLRVLAILSDLAQRADAIAFAEDLLDPLRGSRKQDTDLLTVVFAYITNGGNLNATSRELFMHRNTVLYKLDKAAQLLGMDLRVAENRFMVWLAHHIQMLSEVEAAVDREINPAP